MNTQTRDEIALWLLDRVAQGAHEEVGSMDFDTFSDGQEEFRVTIMKDESEKYLVWMMDCACEDFIIEQNCTEELIRNAIDFWYDML